LDNQVWVENRHSGSKKDFGAHTLRKTAYLFAIWAIGKDLTDEVFQIIMDSARHEDVKTARGYARGAKVALQQMSELGLEIPFGMI
jgi:integrase